MALPRQTPPQIFDVPDALGYGLKPIEVWLEGTFANEWTEVSDRVVPERVFHSIDTVLDKLDILYRFDENQKPIINENTGAFQSDYLGRAIDELNMDKRIRVYVSHPDPGGKVCLFEGRLGSSQPAWTWSANNPRQGIKLVYESVLSDWNDDLRAQIIGRWLHGFRQEPGGEPEAPGVYDAASLVGVQSQSCIFNEGGKPNCSPHPIDVEIKMGNDGSGTAETITVPLYVFTPRHLPYVRQADGTYVQREGIADQQEDVKSWTYARALFYLIYFHGYRSFVDETGPNADQLPIRMPNIFRQFGTSTAPQWPVTNLLDDEPLDNPSSESDLLVRALLGRPNDLACDRTSLQEALVIISGAAGLHYHVEYETVSGSLSPNANGVPETYPRLEVWGPPIPKQLDQTVPIYKIFRHRPREVMTTWSDRLKMQGLRSAAGTLTYDYRDLVNAPLVVGETRSYEVTVELVPGWRPYGQLDNITGTGPVEGARRFWRPLGSGTGGAPNPNDVRFRLLPTHESFPLFADVARKWVLNEHGQYTGLTSNGPPEVVDYARNVPDPHPVWGPSAYNVFDWSTLPINDWIMIGDPPPFLRPNVFPKWAHIPRPFGDVLTQMPGGDISAFVEISFDSGATWQREKQVQVSPTEAAITITADNPILVAPVPSGGTPTNWQDDNMIFAIIENRFRVRVTATVQGDQKLVAREGPQARFRIASRITRAKSRILNRPDFRYRSRFANGSVLANLAIESDDNQQVDILNADRYRQNVGQALGDRQLAMSLQAPWIDRYPSRGMPVVDGSKIGVNVNTRTDAKPNFPQIVGIAYALQGPQTTEVIVDDLRHIPEEVPV